MTSKEFAQMVNGREYDYPQFTENEMEIAKNNGLVIVYGACDCLMEFDGAICDEGSCFAGGKVYFTKDGVVNRPTISNIRCIEALWQDTYGDDNSDDTLTWKYLTDIPHETFMINDNGKPYCRGIVFTLEDL